MDHIITKTRYIETDIPKLLRTIKEHRKTYNIIKKLTGKEMSVSDDLLYMNMLSILSYKKGEDTWENRIKIMNKTDYSNE